MIHTQNIFESVNIREPWREFVSAFTVPALLITADVAMNAIVAPAVAQEAVSLSPFIQVAPVPNAGHNIRRENYSAYMNALPVFLS